MKQVVLIKGIRLACPFCGREVTFGTTADYDCVSAHLLPECEGFLSQDPLAFLRSVNAQLAEKVKQVRCSSRTAGEHRRNSS